MSISLSIPKTAEHFPLDGLLTLTRAAFGLGVGLVIAERMSQPARRATAIALVSLGTLAGIPLLVKLAMERINHPGSERIMRRRLNSIRGDSGYRSELDVI